MLRHAGRPLMAEAVAAAGKAAAAPFASASAAAAASATSGDKPTRRHRDARKPLSERYERGGFPHPSLNTKYSALLVGEHFGRLVFDRRSEMLAVLSATNLIREVIAGEGRILLQSNDKRMEAEMLAAARDSGEFSYSGKWPPGGFTNRPQVSVVPQLPSLVISLDHDNHVLMREAFQMCIPRVAPVDVFNNKADFTPEVPLHAAQYTLHEKRRMLAFFTSFIAKLKYGQMPVGDTQGRFKEFALKMRSSYAAEERDIPAPYLRAASRPADSRPDLKYGIKPVHVAYNAQRAGEESRDYLNAALQPDSYMDAAATEDDIAARDLPPIETYNIGDTIEYSQLSDKYSASRDSDAGTFVVDEDGQLVEDLNARDFEHEEVMADLRARREAGITALPHWNPAQGTSESERRGEALQRNISRTPDAEVREQYEQWIADRQDAANDFIPYSDKTEYDLNSKFSDPSERDTQERLWKLKTRVRENTIGRQEQIDRKAETARLQRRTSAPKLNSIAMQVPHLDIGMLTGDGKKQFSTLSTAASRRAYSSNARSSTDSSSSSTTATPTPAFRFPRFLLPAFLLVPALAYWGSMQHSDETDLVAVRDGQAQTLAEWKQKFGFASADDIAAATTQSLKSAERAALTAELTEARTRLGALVQMRALVFERIPESERKDHAAILDDLEASKRELEEDVARLEKQLRAC